jgi:hypothetical protein
MLVLLLHGCDGDAFFFAQRLAMLESHRPLPGFESDVVHKHIPDEAGKYECKSEIDFVNA